MACHGFSKGLGGFVMTVSGRGTPEKTGGVE